MRAAVRARYGGPEVVEFDDLPEPTAGPGEIVVRVRATTVNRTDTAYRSGRPWINRVVCGLPRPKVQVLGSEYAGDVVEVGEGVDGHSVGDRVFGFVEGRPGAHAELVAVAASGLVAKVPDGWDHATAAAGMEGAHYAHACLRVTGIGEGDRALVHGATGAIGSALVQLLVAEGVEVTAVCDQLPPEFTDQLAHLEGVRWVAARQARNAFLELRETMQGDSVEHRFDAVMDATGHLSFGEARRFLRPGGAYVSSDLGRGGQNLLLAATAPVARRLGRRHARFPFPHSDAALAAYITGLMERGAYRPVVDRSFDFEQLRDAHEYVDSGRKLGNVVVLMPEATEA